MRILMTTRGNAGHVLPLAPFGHVWERAGHDVLVVAQARHAANVERAGLRFTPVADPPEHEWMPLFEEFATLPVDAADARMIGEYFARIDTAAALPGLRAIVERWRPDVIVRESWEFASTLVAELHGIPLLRVGLGLAAVEAWTVRTAAPALDRTRGALGLPADPAGERLRETPYLTTIPAPLEDPGTPPPRRTLRFGHRAPGHAPPLPDWWRGNDDPLVYVTFGSVAGYTHLPYFPVLYRAAIEALAPLPIRVLMTVGDDREPGALGPLPPNVRVERWVAQDAILPHAAAMVCHGGHGSTLGALSHGVPLVVAPLFSGDQWENAAAVARAGAGVALDAERATRRVLDLPGAATLGELGPAVGRVLADPAYGVSARRVADAMRALPPVEAAVDVLGALVGERALVTR